MNKTESNLPPLAERVRPASIGEFIGQEHLVRKGTLLRKAMEKGELFSFILWGPPGSGKTTLAKISAQETNSDFYEISAVSSGVRELRKLLNIGKTNSLMNKTTILFIDEIHRFNKAQQDALLHGIEEGTLILIGATTENPSFEVTPPLLSRCRILKLKSLRGHDLNSILNRALETDILLRKMDISFSLGVRELLIQSSGGDARKMLNAFEGALLLSPQKGKKIVITEKMVMEALQDKRHLYDKVGDYHYDTISAFIKSVRGSDPDAAIYWLVVMLEGGEKPEFIARRLIILASEDIGNADPQALPLATAGFQAVHMIGMPEASLVLAQVTTYLAASPKSNASYLALSKAKETLRRKGTSSVPLHLRNAPTPLMKSLEYSKDYDYPHDHPDHFIDVNYFPDRMKPVTFYHPTMQGYEKFIRKRLNHLWKQRYAKQP